YLWRSTRPGGRVLTWILAVLCGALVAFAGYTDIVGFTLAIPLCGLPTLKREQRGMALWVAQFLLSILTMAGVFCLLVQMDSVMSGSSFERVLGAWGATYGLKGADYDFFFREGGYETIFLMVLIALGLFTFMRRKNEEMFSPWIMTVLSITLMRILGVVTPNMNGSYQMYFAMTGLAGVALSELFVRDGGVSAETADVPETVAEDVDEEHAGPVPVRSEQPVIGTWPPLEPVAAADAVVMEEVEQSRRPEEPVRRKLLRKQKQQEQTDVTVGESLTQEPAAEHSEAEIPAVEVKKDMIKKKQEEITVQQEETPKQVQFIENPLPLPKKHVKKVMDYPIQPPPSQMHYDIEVDPKDNFDF
ncbi:MAG: hypothetical protein K2I21_01235, partial [Acetatifactor sp.]|nr:hypothetical protein [Acetatifactor sp.]